MGSVQFFNQLRLIPDEKSNTKFNSERGLLLNPRKIIAVLCPCCRKPLYRTIATAGAHGKAMHSGDATNPSIDHDRNGEFVSSQSAASNAGISRIRHSCRGQSTDWWRRQTSWLCRVCLLEASCDTAACDSRGTTPI